METENLALVRNYLNALESGAVGENLARFFSVDTIQVELPNKLNPDGGQSDLPALLARAELGQKVFHQQSYLIKSETVQGSRIAIEAMWTGVLAAPFGALPAGGTMRAHFAIFFEITDGRISSQRNYDCFES
ncbi:MAG: nuclear transport factor 2 family protein [Moraxellaceae bacterium]|nr:MAG: nuclear transport factor 2 family protein [Moraxellaceae bacterium]